MFKNAITVYFQGNAATRRGIWSVRTFRDSFRACGFLTDIEWRAECDYESDTMTITSPEPYAARLMAYFVNHIREKILHGLGNYSINVIITVVKTDIYSDRESHRIGVLVNYGVLKKFNLVISAPDIAQNFIGNFEYLYEQMECMQHWDVNSVSTPASIPDGVQFWCKEQDAHALVSHLQESIQDQLPDMLNAISDEPLLDVFTEFFRRGSRLYIRVGLERLYDTEWGQKTQSLPICDSHLYVSSLPDDACAICLQNMEQELVVTECQHMYHKECMQLLWNSATPFKCPLCRLDMKELQIVKLCVPTVKRPIRRSKRLQNRKKRKFKE